MSFLPALLQRFSFNSTGIMPSGINFSAPFCGFIQNQSQMPITSFANTNFSFNGCSTNFNTDSIFMPQFNIQNTFSSMGMNNMFSSFYQPITFGSFKTKPFKADTSGTSRFSDTDTSNYTNDAVTLKNKWSRLKPSLSQEFYNKVVQIANRINCSADDLMALMNSESGLNHDIVNGIGATGLIQFLPKTAKGLGTTTAALRQMTPEQQLVYVEKHLTTTKKWAGFSDSERLGPGTLYALVFLPAYAKRDVLADRDNDPNGYYSSNKGVDIDGDGKITKADLAKRIDMKRA